MPELPRYSDEIGQRIGFGREQVVYEDLKNPDLVVKEKRIGNADGIERFALLAEEVKADFYLTKIAHALFPDTVPDIASASARMTDEGTSQKLTQKIDVLADPDQHIVQTTISKGERRMALERIQTDPTVKETIQKLEGAGFDPEVASINFVRNTKNGTVAYVDSFSLEGVDTKKIQLAIEKMTDEQAKRQVTKWFERFILLRDQAREKRKTMNTEEPKNSL